jgi:hypothetical protein
MVPQLMNFHLADPLDKRFKDKLESISIGLSDDLGGVSEVHGEKADSLVAAILESACQASHYRNITLGLEAASELPREWLLSRIERVAGQLLDWTDEWEYCRLLELAESLDSSLLARLVDRGLGSHDEGIAEAARKFQV